MKQPLRVPKKNMRQTRYSKAPKEIGEAIEKAEVIKDFLPASLCLYRNFSVFP
jgi:hypothetical protein